MTKVSSRPYKYAQTSFTGPPSSAAKRITPDPQSWRTCDNVGREQLDLGHVYGYRLGPIAEGTLVTSYYDWSAAEQSWKDAALFPVIPESALRATLGILARTVAPGKPRPAPLSPSRPPAIWLPALSRLEAGGVVPTILQLEWISAALDVGLIVEIARHAA